MTVHVVVGGGAKGDEEDGGGRLAAMSALSLSTLLNVQANTLPEISVQGLQQGSASTLVPSVTLPTPGANLSAELARLLASVQAALILTDLTRPTGTGARFTKEHIVSSSARLRFQAARLLKS